MTKEEILAMKPGRELDALVAEKVFKMVINKRVEFIPLMSRHPNSGEGFGWTIIPEYSTDISAAWEVIEKVDKFWHDFNIGRHRGKWSLGWNFTNYVKDMDSAPEAICKAALLAVMEE